jgi:hypothetical protein
MRCWSCHKADMKLTEDKAGHPFFRCPECGATHVDISNVGAPALAGRELILPGDRRLGSKWKPRAIRRKK